MLGLLFLPPLLHCLLVQPPLLDALILLQPPLKLMQPFRLQLMGFRQCVDRELWPASTKYSVFRSCVAQAIATDAVLSGLALIRVNADGMPMCNQMTSFASLGHVLCCQSAAAQIGSWRVNRRAGGQAMSRYFQVTVPLLTSQCST